MNITNKNFSSIEQMTGQLLNNRPKTAGNPAGNSSVTFDDILKGKEQLKAASELKFSKHADERLKSRNIDLSTEQLERLENGASRARQKGIQESLVMVDDLAFIVNVKNNVVVTAVKDNSDSIFTNIDGAVIS